VCFIIPLSNHLADKRFRFHRNMTRPFFTKERVSDYDVFDRHAEDVISAMKARIEEGFPVEFQVNTSRGMRSNFALTSLYHRMLCLVSLSTLQRNFSLGKM